MSPSDEPPPQVAVRIVRLVDLPHWQTRLGELDPIFFEASLTKTFASDGERAAFRDRWLGRYLGHLAPLTHVAIDPAGTIRGYIVGAHDDPAREPRFADIGYYGVLAHLTARYPAHLHINLDAGCRNQGVGRRLVASFLADAAEAGVAGVHLVTGAHSRNRSFYARNGFAEVAALTWHGTPIVMLAREVEA